MAILKPITTAISLSLILAIALPAIAAYKPRNRRPPRTNITHTGTRDNCNSQKLLVKPLAPKDHIAELGQHTKTTTPLTLAWSISNPQAATKLNLEVNLYRLGTTQAFVTNLPITKLADNRWIATIDQPLEPGPYVWHLSNICGPSPSKIAEVEFEISPIPLEVETAIENAKTPEERSQIYTEAGFWYNAIDEAVRSDRPNTLSDLLKDLNMQDITDNHPSPEGFRS